MANVTVTYDPSGRILLGPTDTLTGIVDGPLLSEGSLLTIGVPPGATLNHLDASATGSTKRIALRTNANFLGTTRIRAVRLQYLTPDGGVTFFWVQYE